WPSLSFRAERGTPPHRTLFCVMNLFFPCANRTFLLRLSNAPAQCASTQRFSRPDIVDFQSRDVLRFGAQSFRRAGQHWKSRVVHWNDVLDAEQANGE